MARVPYDNKLATKPTSLRVADGFSLIHCYITATVRCAPPDNKHTQEEMKNCPMYLEKEIQYLENIRVLVCLGRIAFDATCKILGIKKAKFAHGNVIKLKNYTVVYSYHPSRQNTQTGRLVWDQWNSIFVLAKKLAKHA